MQTNIDCTLNFLPHSLIGLVSALENAPTILWWGHREPGSRLFNVKGRLKHSNNAIILFFLVEVGGFSTFAHLLNCLEAHLSLWSRQSFVSLFSCFLFEFDNQIMRRAGLSLWPTINNKYFLVKSELNSKTFPQAAFSMCTLGVCCALWSAVITDRSKVINWPSDSRVHSAFDDHFLVLFLLWPF